MKNKLIIFINDEYGATAAEYAIMVSLIAIVIIATVTILGLNVSNFFVNAADNFQDF